MALSPAGGGRFTLEQAAGGAAFAVDDDCVARITVDAARGPVDVMPVTMHVRGTVAAGSPELQYAG